MNTGSASVGESGVLDVVIESPFGSITISVGAFSAIASNSSVAGGGSASTLPGCRPPTVVSVLPLPWAMTAKVGDL